MSEAIKITDASELQAFDSGDLVGELYADGEVYVLATDLIRWRNRQPLAVLEASMEVSQS